MGRVYDCLSKLRIQLSKKFSFRDFPSDLCPSPKYPRDLSIDLGYFILGQVENSEENDRIFTSPARKSRISILQFKNLVVTLFYFVKNNITYFLDRKRHNKRLSKHPSVANSIFTKKIIRIKDSVYTVYYFIAKFDQLPVLERFLKILMKSKNFALFLIKILFKEKLLKA